jgi:hypothetical protein
LMAIRDQTSTTVPGARSRAAVMVGAPLIVAAGVVATHFMTGVGSAVILTSTATVFAAEVGLGKKGSP